MRTSLRVFAAALSALLVAAFLTVVPFGSKAQALNGVSTISVDNVTVSEATGSVTFHVTVQPTPSVPFDEIEADIKTVDDTARAGQDYNAFTRHVSWDANDDATITVTVANAIINDTGREPSEKFTLSIINTVSASPGAPGSVTITDAGDGNGAAPTFVIQPQGPAPEGDGPGNRSVTVSVTNPSTLPISIDYATADGTATSDSEKGAKDYTPKSGTLTWAPADNGAAKQINIAIIGDTFAEPDESFFVNFGGLDNAQFQNGQAAPELVLQNDDGAPSDVPKLTLENIPDKTEGDTGTSDQTITVTLAPAAPQAVTVNYATSNGTAVASTPDALGDYTETKGTLTFPQGTTSKSFTVPVVGDPADELDETYHVTLSAPANALITDPATKDAKILNNDFGQITTVAGQNGGPHVRIFGATASELGGFFAYEAALTSGMHVARGDFFKADGSAGGDGIDEIVTAPGAFPPNASLKSKPVVRIFAVDGTQRASFFAFDPNFSGGVYVAAGNIDGDTANGDELVVGAGGGGGAPHVRVLRVAG
ncbi:MAG: large repetitive protein, partial [Actinomycetota bacterium]